MYPLGWDSRGAGRCLSPQDLAETQLTWDFSGEPLIASMSLSTC